jgi:uncharacterized membrane protein YGL010W
VFDSLITPQMLADFTVFDYQPLGRIISTHVSAGSIAMKKTADKWFAEYGECHHNSVNEVIHWICIPAIMLSVLGLLWSIPMPASWGSLSDYVNVATLFLVGSLIFYFRLSPTLAAGMLAIAVLFLALIIGYGRAGWTPVWSVALGIFVVAWILQFVGHKIEGKKPAFFQDLQFLLIGPLWLLGFIYRRVGIPY